MIYKFKNGNTYCGIDAATAASELERIRLANGGKLKPEDVLKSAEPRGSLLHTVFTWNDEKAAQSYRVWQARAFIKSVVVIKNEGEAPHPAYWNVVVSASPSVTEAEHYYQSAAVVARDSKVYEAALKVSLRELAAAQRGLEHLRSLAPRRSKTNLKQASGHVESAQQVLTNMTASEQSSI